MYIYGAEHLSLNYYTHYSLYMLDCKDGSLRLLDGSTPLIGRVEVCVGGSWGTICDEYWDNNDARVACRQLGYSPEGISSNILIL